MSKSMRGLCAQFTLFRHFSGGTEPFQSLLYTMIRGLQLQYATPV